MGTLGHFIIARKKITTLCFEYILLSTGSTRGLHSVPVGSPVHTYALRRRHHFVTFSVVFKCVYVGGGGGGHGTVHARINSSLTF